MKDIWMYIVPSEIQSSLSIIGFNGCKEIYKVTESVGPNPPWVMTFGVGWLLDSVEIENILCA